MPLGLKITFLRWMSYWHFSPNFMIELPNSPTCSPILKFGEQCQRDIDLTLVLIYITKIVHFLNFLFPHPLNSSQSYHFSYSHPVLSNKASPLHPIYLCSNVSTSSRHFSHFLITSGFPNQFSLFPCYHIWSLLWFSSLFLSTSC